MARQYYFEYNGKRYPSGTEIVIKKFNCITSQIDEVPATFLHITDRGMYELQVSSWQTNGFWKDQFYNKLVAVKEKPVVTTNTTDTVSAQTAIKHKRHTFRDECSIDGLLLAWIWYVFLMAVTSIFTARFGLWAIISVIFFCYRGKKLREAGFDK